MKKKKIHSKAMSLHFPAWLKLRIMNDGMKNQADWMIKKAEACNADSVTIRLRLKNRPWIVSLSVKRYYGKRA